MEQYVIPSCIAVLTAIVTVAVAAQRIRSQGDDHERRLALLEARSNLIYEKLQEISSSLARLDERLLALVARTGMLERDTDVRVTRSKGMM